LGRGRDLLFPHYTVIARRAKINHPLPPNPVSCFRAFATIVFRFSLGTLCAAFFAAGALLCCSLRAWRLGERHILLSPSRQIPHGKPSMQYFATSAFFAVDVLGFVNLHDFQNNR
jgi:hypothetical protein